MKFECFNDMWKWLQKTFPNINFTFVDDIERDKYPNQCFTNNENTVYIGKYTEVHKCLYSVFHELGHIECKNREAMSVYEIEEFAWSYAASLMDKYHVVITAGMRSYMLQQLASYCTDEHKSHKTNTPYDVKAITLSWTKEEILHNYDASTDTCKTLQCPYCGSHQLDSDTFIIDPSIITVVHVICKRCHKVGINVIGAYKDENL